MMKISKIRIKNFRSLKNIDLKPSHMIYIIGYKIILEWLKN